MVIIFNCSPTYVSNEIRNNRHFVIEKSIYYAKILLTALDAKFPS